MLLIDSIFLNSLGGKVLLQYLVKHLEEKTKEVYYLIDKRSEGQFNFIPNDRKTILKSSVWKRHLFYKKKGHLFSKVFCFANIAPTIRLNAKVICYYHNVIIFDTPLQTIYTKLLWSSKTAFLKLFLKNADCYLFQTNFVQSFFSEKLKYPNSQCGVFPFYNLPEYNVNPTEKNLNQYLYISDAYPYKNHRLLFDAWEKINRINPALSLHITISEPTIVDLATTYKEKGVYIVNHHFLSQEKLNILFEQSAYFIFPSLAETMGIGLLEAAKAGCEIIVADLPYAKEVIQPYAQFNPLDVDEIVETVITNRNYNSKQQHSKILLPNKIQELVDWLIE